MLQYSKCYHTIGSIHLIFSKPGVYYQVLNAFIIVITTSRSYIVILEIYIFSHSYIYYPWSFCTCLILDVSCVAAYSIGPCRGCHGWRPLSWPLVLWYCSMCPYATWSLHSVSLRTTTEFLRQWSSPRWSSSRGANSAGLQGEWGCEGVQRVPVMSELRVPNLLCQSTKSLGHVWTQGAYFVMSEYKEFGSCLNSGCLICHVRVQRVWVMSELRVPILLCQRSEGCEFKSHPGPNSVLSQISQMIEIVIETIHLTLYL